jgi:tRNA (mo5U34)-methyltransferase
MFDLRSEIDRYQLPERLDGMRVLDVGTWDGFWAFEMERRGAAEVVAIDLDDERDLDWPAARRPETFPDKLRGDGFRLAHEVYGSKVKREVVSIYEALPEQLGTFDLIFCGSVLIHLRDPMLALERMAGLCGGQLILAEEHTRRPGMLLSGAGARFTGNSPWSTWWIPTARTWLEMVECAGFDDVRKHGAFNMRFRGKRKGVPHVVIHARGAAS